MSPIEQSQYSRWLALVIFAFLMVIVYLLFFHNFVVQHQELNDEITVLNDARQKYADLTADVPVLRERIAQVRQAVGENDKFLQSDTNNLANSELTGLLKGMVNAIADNSADCQIISQTPTRDPKPDQFEKIVLRVRMRCHYEMMAKLLQRIEESVPSMFVDELRLEQRNVSRYRNRSNVDLTPQPLEVRFDLYAYLNKPIEKNDDEG